DHTVDRGAARGFEQIARAVDIGAIEIRGIGRPQTIIGCDVEDEPAAIDCTAQGVGVAQVAGDRLDVELADLAAGTHECAYQVSVCEKYTSHVPAEEARRSGDQCGFHGRDQYSWLWARRAG